MSIDIVNTESAPAAIGPYSQAIICEGRIYTSGQIPLDCNGKLVTGGIEAQTHQVFANLKAVLGEGSSSLRQVIKTTVFVQNLNDFQAVNEIYASYFGSHAPARSTVQVAALPLGSLIEIEAIASIG